MQQLLLVGFAATPACSALVSEVTNNFKLKCRSFFDFGRSLDMIPLAAPDDDQSNIDP
jgi:hypothetical protein